ncbi:hypothetical protein NEISICOT_01934 [Neisseria sicca ATCC 29256]|uniref:Uncharacterized protein n=1 Tax=Neisseria sicca ATCC 29256 TaxID=547045 RepID=C6M5Y5_NEISI|nr:hypothetical protein NEISICOT_01934 [Neisseria sicca ATCC 29256]
MHGVLEDVDIGFKRFVGMILPACNQFAEHDFLLVNHQTGEIGFCLFVEKPDALGTVDDDNGFLHAVENEAVQPADAAVGKLMAAGRFGRLLQIAGSERSQHGDKVTRAAEQDRSNQGLCIPIKRMQADAAVEQQIEEEQHRRVARVQHGIMPVAEEAGRRDERKDKDAEARIDSASDIHQYHHHRNIDDCAGIGQIQSLPLPVRTGDG